VLIASPAYVFAAEDDEPDDAPVDEDDELEELGVEVSLGVSVAVPEDPEGVEAPPSVEVVVSGVGTAASVAAWAMTGGPTVEPLLEVDVW